MHQRNIYTHIPKGVVSALPLLPQHANGGIHGEPRHRAGKWCDACVYVRYMICMRVCEMHACMWACMRVCEMLCVVLSVYYMFIYSYVFLYVYLCVAMCLYTPTLFTIYKRQTTHQHTNAPTHETKQTNTYHTPNTPKKKHPPRTHPRCWRIYACPSSYNYSNFFTATAAKST